MLFEEELKPLKRQPHKMVKHTQTIRRQKRMNCLTVFGHFVRLAIKGLKTNMPKNIARFQ